MNYYLLFGRFAKGEGSFNVQDPYDMRLMYPVPHHKFLKKKPSVTVSDSYEERGMSDFLKAGYGFIASAKVQQVFFDNGFQGMQFLPVNVKNDGDITGFAFTNPIAHYDILDPIASDADGFEASQGGYSDAGDEVFDRKKFDACDFKHDIFTLSNFKDPFIANEKVKVALEEAGVTGIEFIPLEFSS